VKGVLNGKYTYYHPNGKIDIIGDYSDNIRVGDWIYYSKEGVQDTIINYNE